MHESEKKRVFLSFITEDKDRIQGCDCSPRARNGTEGCRKGCPA